MRISASQIAECIGGRIRMGDEKLICSGISIDSRSIKHGWSFVCIEGPHFDGHDFAKDAMDNGASIIISSMDRIDLKCGCLIEVENTQKALGDIARYWRNQFDIPCIAITGSNGKSTTKEMIASILSSLGAVLKTEGNYNNLIGLPLTIFRLNVKHNVAVLEMGMNAPGEIARLTSIADPSIGLITNVTAAHLEKLHTIKAVAEAKAELFKTMKSDGVIIVNNEDVFISEMAKSYRGKSITFGMRSNSDVRFLNMESDALDS